jgi:uncharacterized membrane protein YdjX (TVP38/TMEM64 family)
MVRPVSGSDTSAAEPRVPKSAPGSSVAARLAAAIVIALTVAGTVELTGALDYLTFDALARNRSTLLSQVHELGLLAALLFVLLYAATTALSLPTGLFLSLIGGFLFGTLWGGTLIVVGATLGAAAAFIAARTILGDVLRARAGPFLRRLEGGFRKNELSYMLVLRLVPLFPFWLVNLAPAFLGVRTRNFIVGTALGIVPGALIFASVGTGLGAILDAGGVPDGSAILRPHFIVPIAGLSVLALVPVAYKKLRRQSETNGAWS